MRNIIDNEIEENNNSDISQNTSFNENREKQLEILNEKYMKLYNSKDKVFSSIIKEIDVESQLLYKGSIRSFNLLILKIKCLMKLLKEKVDKFLVAKEKENYYEIDTTIQKIKSEFRQVYNLVDEDSKYEYEIITQVYCKFLYIMSIISSIKEEHIRSFSYITLGVNMLKIFFVRQK